MKLPSLDKATTTHLASALVGLERRRGHVSLEMINFLERLTIAGARIQSGAVGQERREIVNKPALLPKINAVTLSNQFNISAATTASSGRFVEMRPNSQYDFIVTLL